MDLYNFKVKVTPETSRSVQEYLFQQGLTWPNQPAKVMPFVVSGTVMVEAIEFIWLFLCWPIVSLIATVLEDY